MKGNMRSTAPACDRGDEQDHRHTILLVDDQPIILRALRRVFRNEGYHILSATSGDDALAVLERVRCDLLIVDYLMPKLNGIELIHRVKERWPDMPCVLLTGHTDFAAVAGVIRSGQLYKFALKPWNDNDLRTTVVEALTAARNGRKPDALPEAGGH